MGLFVILFNCFLDKPSTNVINSFIVDTVGFGFCLILLFLQPEKYSNSKSLKSFKLFFRREKFQSFLMSCLTQINHWNKPTQYKEQFFFPFFDVFLSLFFLLSHPMYHPSVMPFRARKKHRWMAQKVCSKDSAYLREALEEIKNHYIKEEGASRYFFAKINSNYILKEITWIQTLIPLRYKI